MNRAYINNCIYLVNDGTSVYEIYGYDVENEINENDVEVIAGPFADTPQNREKIESKIERLNNEMNGIYENKKKGRKILLTNEQIKRLNEMDIQLTSDGTVADTQNVLNKSQQQFNQAKSIDGKNPNATITTPNTDNSKPTAYIQSNPGESPAQAISDNSETVQKAFNNNGCISVEVNEGRYAPITKKELLEIHKRKGQILTKESILNEMSNQEHPKMINGLSEKQIRQIVSETINKIVGR